MRLDLDLDKLVDEVATRVAAELADRIASQAPSPWMAMDEAITYTRIAAGTFRKWLAAARSEPTWRATTRPGSSDRRKR